ncbi:hypothetical protein SOVF_134240 [Spinacia oleracea]|nr:hypothetical protein SOVF_134240 [Spinacia oleracea]
MEQKQGRGRGLRRRRQGGRDKVSTTRKEEGGRGVTPARQKGYAGWGGVAYLRPAWRRRQGGREKVSTTRKEEGRRGSGLGAASRRQGKRSTPAGVVLRGCGQRGGEEDRKRERRKGRRGRGVAVVAGRLQQLRRWWRGCQLYNDFENAKIIQLQPIQSLLSRPSSRSIPESCG